LNFLKVITPRNTLVLDQAAFHLLSESLWPQPKFRRYKSIHNYKTRLNFKTAIFRNVSPCNLVQGYRISDKYITSVFTSESLAAICQFILHHIQKKKK
jgi:hypothetical protein